MFTKTITATVQITVQVDGPVTDADMLEIADEMEYDFYFSDGDGVSIANGTTAQVAGIEWLDSQIS